MERKAAFVQEMQQIKVGRYRDKKQMQEDLRMKEVTRRNQFQQQREVSKKNIILNKL